MLKTERRASGTTSEELTIEFAPAPVRRIQVSGVTQLTEIEVEWRPDRDERTWGTKKGHLKVIPGSAKCFGTDWIFPGNVPTGRLVFRLSPPSKDLSFLLSDLVWDHKAKRCPHLEVLNGIARNFQKAHEDPASETHMAEFTASLKPILSRYDCRRVEDTDAVPAWWVYEASGRKEPREWFNFVYESDLKAAEQFIASDEFKETLDGSLSQEFDLATMQKRREETIRTAELLKGSPRFVGILLSEGKTMVPAFLYEGSHWIRFTQKLPSPRPDWQIAFDGVSREKIILSPRQRLIGGNDGHPAFRLAASHAEVDLATPFTGFANVRTMGNSVFGNRPLLATNRKVTNPDKWRPTETLPKEIVAIVKEKAISETFIGQSCPDGIGNLTDGKVKQSLRVATAPGRNLNFVNAKEEYLLQLDLPSWTDAKTQKRCNAQSDFGTRWAYFVDSARKVTFLGGAVDMIEAADLDGDGTSELVLSGSFEVAEPPNDYPMSGAILLSTGTLRGPVLHWQSRQ